MTNKKKTLVGSLVGHNNSVYRVIEVTELHEDEWTRLRDLRLSSLLESPHAYGGKYEDEKLYTETQWRLGFKKLSFLVASLNGVDVGLMSVEILDGDIDSTCWIGGCWTDPKFRGTGLMRAMFNYLDAHADENNWKVQGLGVWTDNFEAIKAYEFLGFSSIGQPQVSRRLPEKFYQRMIRETTNS